MPGTYGVGKGGNPGTHTQTMPRDARGRLLPFSRDRKTPEGVLRTCQRCGAEKPLDGFATQPLATQGRASTCRRCVNTRKGEQFAAARLAAIEALGGQCVRCGFADERTLEVDHIGRDGKLDRQQRDLYRRYCDIASGHAEGLQLLCCNCHAIKTREDMSEVYARMAAM